MKRKSNTTSIYTANNPYGYKLNINHPKIRNLYDRYCNWKGIATHFPLSDEQRKEFESYVLRIISPP